MAHALPFTIAHVDWAGSKESLRAVRRAVFVVEQQVPEELEWDDDDARCDHVVAVAADGTPIGTGRLLRDGHIGRMAVLKPWRNRGVGGALLTRLLQMAQRAGHEIVRLHAQTHAVGFYARHGFRAEGPEFTEAGIPHFVMSRRLSARA